MDVRGREVIVPTNTFAATAMAVERAGGSVRMADVSPETLCLSVRSLEAVLTRRTVGIIHVHIGGTIWPEVQEIRAWAWRRGLWLLEDAAHAVGSCLDGQCAGAFGTAAAFSFFQTKVVAAGEGGMFTTDDDRLADRARVLRDYGKPEPWVTLVRERQGFNWRLTEASAIIGDVHLHKCSKFVQARRAIAAVYRQELSSIREVSVVTPDAGSNFYKFILLLSASIDRDEIRRLMKARGVHAAGGVYDVPLHRQPAFSGVTGDFPCAEEISRRHLCLPIHPRMTPEQVVYVIRVLRESLRAVS